MEGCLKATQQQEITCLQLQPPGMWSINVRSWAAALTVLFI